MTQGKPEVARGRKSNRLKGYDYSSAGYYFVTICVKDGTNWLGEVRGGRCMLSEYGNLAQDTWSQIPEHYSGVEIDEFIVMPNHIHGIVVITGNVGTEQCSVPTGHYGLLSGVVKSFKETFVKAIKRRSGTLDFRWQRSFYDRVIRNEESLYDIRRYISNNPARWGYDRENPDAVRDAQRDAGRHRVRDTCRGGAV